MRILLLVIMLGISLPAKADDLQLAEQKIKAGLLYNFLKYTEWPAAADNKLLINVCIFGADPFGGSLQPMQGRSVNQRRIALQVVTDIAAANSCHLLFINADNQDSWPQIKSALAGKNILTVADFANFAKSGGMIEFQKKDNRIEATINLKAVKKSGLAVGERLLKLVTVMNEGEND